MHATRCRWQRPSALHLALQAATLLSAQLLLYSLHLEHILQHRHDIVCREPLTLSTSPRLRHSTLSLIWPVVYLN